MSKTIVILVMVSWLLIGLVAYSFYNNLVQEYNSLVGNYNELAHDYNELRNSYFELWNNSFIHEANCTAVTILYYTDYTTAQHLITLSVPYEKYDVYHEKDHPYWGEDDLISSTNYVTCNETVISQVVETIRNQTYSEEELANALLDFVQDKNCAMSVRYYPTTELKYPIETLVEMGGDCDTHSFLYTTLMKAAGFKVLLLFSNETLSDGLHHVATAVQLENPPEHSSLEYPSAPFIYNDEKYYFAETTMWGSRVGDLPENFKDLTFQIVPV